MKIDRPTMETIEGDEFGHVTDITQKTTSNKQNRTKNKSLQDLLPADTSVVFSY